MFYFAGDGQGTRSLWNNGKDMTWYHISKIVSDEMNNGLKLIPKLTLEHVQLNSCSIMKVHLARQVLSESVSNRMLHMLQLNFVDSWTCLSTV